LGFVIQLNLRSTFLCTRYAAPHMMQQRYGKIVCISSGVREGTPFGLGHITVYIFGKPYLPTFHIAFKASRNSAEVPRSSKESCCPIMAVRFV
jgi:NAD(P)-dependent dehydrogenase (short-subunit alcohol dehydrogenase family)